MEYKKEDLESIRIGANMGIPESLYHMGLYNFTEKKDYVKAFIYFYAAAHKDNINSVFYIALCYHKGLGVEQNLRKAIYYYELAVEYDDTDAINMLGKCYEYGEGVDKDKEIALSLYHLASDLGNKRATRNMELLKKNM